MKAFNLVFFRHGIADDSTPDHARALTEEGIRKTRTSAEGLKKMKILVERIFTSPWVRASQTAAILAEVLVLSAPSVLPELAGDRPAADLLRALQEHAGGSMLLVGHQPLLGVAIAQLIGAGEGCEIDLRKSGACAIEVDAIPSRKPAILKWLLTAKQLRASGR